MAKNEIIIMLKSFILLLRSEGIAVDKAYLYGSYLSANTTKDSDIDLMIITGKEYDDNTIFNKYMQLSKNPRNEIGKSQKIYFYVCGIRNAVISGSKKTHQLPTRTPVIPLKGVRLTHCALWTSPSLLR